MTVIEQTKKLKGNETKISLKERETERRKSKIQDFAYTTTKSQSLVSYIKKIALTLICSASQTLQTYQAPLSTPTLVVEGKSNDATWNNQLSTAFTTTRKGSQIATSRYILYTSYEISTTAGPTVTIFDSQSATVQPIMSNNGLRITNHFASFNGGDTKFAVIETVSTQTLIKILNNNFENTPVVIKTMPVTPTLTLTIFYDESSNTLVVGSTDGCYKADTSLDSPTYTKYTNIASGNNYYNIIKEKTSGSTLAFTIGSTNKLLQNFDYSDIATALTNQITLSSPGTAIAQSSRDSKRLLVALDYSGGKSLAYYADYTSTTLTQEVTFNPDNGDKVDYPYMWPIPETTNFFVAPIKKVYLVESTSTAITLTDKSSNFLSVADEEILTSFVFFTDEKYLVAAGYKQNSYAFIKKMNFIGDCHANCLTCSFGGDETKCLTCSSDRYLYQPDATTSKCLLGTECRDITDYYTNNSTKKCVSKTQCLTSLRYLVEEYSDCVYECPSTHLFILEDATPDPDLKECLTTTQCQEKTDYVTLREENKCITNDACITTKSYKIIKSVSDCVAKCADDPLGTSLWLDSSNFCVTAEYCQHADRSPRSYTKNNTAGYECVTACAPTLKIITYWNDCVTTCSNYDPPLWEHGDNCINTNDCKTTNSKFTQISSDKCVDAETCSTTDSQFIITEDDKKICVETCGVGEAASYNYKFTDPTPTTADTDYNKCFSADGCKNGGYYRKHDTFECKTEDQCSADAATGIAWFLVKDSINDCIQRCPEHAAGTHIYKDRTAAKRTCTTKAACGTATNFIDEVEETCVSKEQCNTASKYTNETDCMLTCAVIGEYGITSDKTCKTDTECKATADGADTYLVRYSDNTCVTHSECNTANEFHVVGQKECVVNCDVDTTNHIYAELTNKKCYDEAGCKALDTHAVYKPSSLCITVADCIGASNLFYHASEVSECIEKCPPTVYKYFDLADSANRVCRSETNCQTDKFTRDTDYNCVTADECKTGLMYTTSTKKCVSVCPTGEYKLELTDSWSCVSVDQCKAQTSPSQHYMIDDDILRCVTGDVCKGTTYNRFMDDTNLKCVFNCELKASPKIFTDRTDGKCLTGAECQAVNSGGQRSTFNETKECLTDTECTGTGAGELNAFIVTEFRDCVRQCEDAYPDHALIDSENPKNCLSPTQCSDASKFIREDKKLCLTADACKTAGRYTTSDNFCVSECPATQYKLQLTTAYKCVTATECEAETTGSQHYKIDDGIMVCASEDTCTGTGAGKYGRYLIKETKMCVHDCATQATYFFTDETLKLCHSEASCQTFDSAGGSTPDRLAKIDTKECLTEATCIGGTVNYKKIIDTSGPVRLCVEDCEEKSTHPYRKGVSGTECYSKAQCEADTSYGYIREKKKICMSSSECYTDLGYIHELTTGSGKGTCDDICPTGEYKWTDGSTKNECLTAAECWTKNLNTDDEFDTCISDSDCTTATKFYMIDNSASAPKPRNCLAECSTHTTHKWTNGNVCLTGKECQDTTDRFTQNNTYLCVPEATCIADKMVVNKEGGLNDCTFTCPSTLWKNSAGNCVTATACQVDTPAVTYTLNQSDPENICILKTECDGYGYLTIESYNDCRASCPSKADSEHYLTYLATKHCFTEGECKAVGTTYIFLETSSCIDKTTCTGFTYFTTGYDIKTCTSSCPTNHYAFNPSNEYECVTEADCLAKTPPIYLEKDNFKCFSKTECTAAGRFTQTGNNECLKDCPDSFYKLDTDNTCIDQATCTGTTNNRYTFNSTKECILLTTCQSRTMVHVEAWKDCACPQSHPYYDPESKTCLNADECVLKNKFTQNDTNLCLTETECISMTPSAGFIVDAWNDCVTDCSVAGTQIYNLKRTADPPNRCVSNQMCKSFTDGYVSDQTPSNCLKKAECTTNSLKSIEEGRECVSDCANSATHKYTDDVNGVCYTAKGCQNLSDRYTYNTTMKCVTKAFCNTDLTSYVIEDWSDCLSACINIPGQHRFLDDTLKTCFTGIQCQARDGFYTQNSTNKCVDENTCVTTDSRKILKEWSDCVVDCASHVTHFYVFGANECTSSGYCQSKSDGYTFNSSTPKTCVTQAECVAKPAYVDQDYHDCVNPCPTGYLLDQNQCLTNLECTNKGYYINTADSTCLQSCPDPLLHDLTLQTCVTSCPAELYTSSTDRKCYTLNGCLALSEDHWIYPAEKTCQSGCSLFKEESSRSCIAKTTCRDKALDTGSKCYVELSINDQKVGVASGNNGESNSNNPVVKRTENGDSDIITIFLRLPIKVANLESFVENISYEISTSEIKGRLLQSGQVNSFKFSEGTTPGEYKVEFDSPLREEYLANIKLKENIVIYYQGEGDKYPGLYKLDLTTMTFTIPPRGPRNYTIAEGITMAYDGVLKVIPTLSTLFSIVSSTRFMPFPSDNYNKLVIYSRAKALNLRDENLKESHNFTFVDWTGRLNKMLYSRISEKIVSDDIQIVCDDPARQSCYNRVNANIFLNKSIFMIIFLLMLMFIGKRRVKYGLLPVFWFSFQLFVNYDLIHNIIFFEFKGLMHIIGLIMSIIFSLAVILIFLRYTLDKSVQGENFKNDLSNNVFFNIFKDRKLMGEFLMLKFITGILISVASAAFNPIPAVQAIIFVVFELVNVICSFTRGYFNFKIFNIWNMITSVLFLLLAVFTLILGISNSGSSNFVDVMAYYISWALVIVDIIWILISFKILKKEIDEPYTGNSREKPYKVSESYQPPVENPRTMVKNVTKTPEKKEELKNNVSNVKSEKSFMFNGKAMTYKKKRLNNLDNENNIQRNPQSPPDSNSINSKVPGTHSTRKNGY